MTWLLDTNILLRLSLPHDPQFSLINSVMIKLIARGDDLALLPQSLYEIWVVITRPLTQNGYGYHAVRADQWIKHTMTFGTLLAETPALFPQWLDLVRTHNVSGKPAHDARLVAGMMVHGITNILTFNTSDFSRYPITAISPVSTNFL